MSDCAKQMLDDTLHELSMKGDAVMDFYDSMCIIRLRQVINWSLEEIWRIRASEKITDEMWDDHAELVANVDAAQRMLEYLGASEKENSDG